jgi:hypothetical protein
VREIPLCVGPEGSVAVQGPRTVLTVFLSLDARVQRSDDELPAMLFLMEGWIASLCHQGATPVVTPGY